MNNGTMLTVVTSFAVMQYEGGISRLFTVGERQGTIPSGIGPSILIRAACGPWNAERRRIWVPDGH